MFYRCHITRQANFDKRILFPKTIKSFKLSNILSLSVPDEGYSSVPDEGYSSVPDEGYY